MRCFFCDPSEMAAVAANPRQRSRRLAAALRVFLQHYDQRPTVYDTAILQVPEEWRGSMPAPDLMPWRDVLANRRLAGSRELKDSDYAVLVRKDRR